MGEPNNFLAYKTNYQEKVDTLSEENRLDTAMSLAVSGGFDVIDKLEFLLLKQFGLLPTDSVIDIGCGSGRLAIQLQDYLTGEYLGTDVVEEQVLYAREKCPKENFKFSLANRFFLPKEDCSVDLICFFSVLTHLSHVNSFRYLKEASRVLREGGRIILSFLEFKIGQHWSVFESTFNDETNTGVLDQFISRDAIDAWASHLGLKVVSIEDGNKYFIRIPDSLEISDPNLIFEKSGRLGESVCVLEKQFIDFDSHTSTIYPTKITINLKIRKSMCGKNGNIFVAALDRETNIFYSAISKSFTRIDLRELSPIANVIYGEHSLDLEFENLDLVDCKYLDVYVGYGENSDEMVKNHRFIFVHTLQAARPQQIEQSAVHQELLVPATHENYSTSEYLAANPDVARSLMSCDIISAYDHFQSHGIREKRQIRRKINSELRKNKIKKIEGILDKSSRFYFDDGFFDFINPDRSSADFKKNTESVSENRYDENALKLINRFKDGLVLDCGAGQRSVYYENVVNMDIFPYDAVDVVAIAEEMPFLESSFDAVICLAVLEHVKNPFKCAKELIRVLKPGGKILCAVPFLQPFHGYPDHYYNMTSHGLINLFQDGIDIEKIDVYGGFLPIGSLTWILKSWSDGLVGETKNSFLNMKIGDLTESTEVYLSKPFVRELSREKNLELASATALFGEKKQ